MFTPIPIALVEPNEDFARAIQQALLPHFQVVHVCLNVETAVHELPNCYAGPAAGMPHACGVGTNMVVSADERVEPRAVLIGADVDPKATFAIRDSAERALPNVVTHKLDLGGEDPAADVGMTMIRIQEQLRKLVDDGLLKAEGEWY